MSSISPAPRSPNPASRSMSPTDLPQEVWDHALATISPSSLDWLWHGYVATGNITLLTSRWKAGKTTLLSLLLSRRKTGGSKQREGTSRTTPLCGHQEAASQTTPSPPGSGKVRARPKLLPSPPTSGGEGRVRGVPSPASPSSRARPSSSLINTADPLG
jgi:hypothetical protein